MNKLLFLTLAIVVIFCYVGLNESYASPIDESAIAESPQDKGQTTELLTRALNSIKDAEASGADISELAGQFNRAIEMTRAADTTDTATCESSETCIEDANQIYRSIIEEGPNLNAKAEWRYYQNLAIGQLTAILVAFGLSLAGVYLYEQYRLAELKRFLKMEIKEI